MRGTFVVTAAAIAFAGAALVSLRAGAGTAVAQSPPETSAGSGASAEESAVTTATDASAAIAVSRGEAASFAEPMEPNLFLVQLRERERDLERREQALANERETLRAIQGEIESRIAELQQVRDAMAPRLQEIDRARQQRIASLAAWCAGMEPRAAAEHLATQDVDAIADVLTAMDERAAAAVLEQIPTERAGQVMRSMSAPR